MVNYALFYKTVSYEISTTKYLNLVKRELSDDISKSYGPNSCVDQNISIKYTSDQYVGYLYGNSINLGAWDQVGRKQKAKIGNAGRMNLSKLH